MNSHTKKLASLASKETLPTTNCIKMKTLNT
jgi:hypothetical protein